MNCPKCGKDRAHRDERSGAVDQILNWFVIKPYICHECRYRFHRFPDGQSGPTVRMELEQRRLQLFRRKGWRRTFRELVFYCLAFVVMGAVFYFVFRQSATTVLK